MLLLSSGVLNHKIKKNIKEGYLTFSLNLAHSNISGYNVCPKAEKFFQDPNNKTSDKLAGCSDSCVGYGGLAGVYPAVMESRIKKTISFFKDREYFLNSLVYEIEKAIKIAHNKNLKPAFRLNAYSDILWERYKIKDNKNIFELFPETAFYDYSKIVNRKTPANYQITYSHYGNWQETQTALNQGINVAMVFEKLPKQITINNISYIVVDGDITDLRLNESINNKPVIVGLKFKGSKAELTKAINERFTIPLKESYFYYV
tara:strand:+ start:453 stop:1232 length:780 start_codon:yes stop_codon:yes gene_type:complete